MAGILTLRLLKNQENILQTTEDSPNAFKKFQSRHRYKASMFPIMYYSSNSQKPSFRSKSRQERTRSTFCIKKRQPLLFPSANYREFSMLKQLGNKCLLCKRLKCTCF